MFPFTIIYPMLGPLADNGGPTWTHALLPGSPAIDAGDPALCEATDQRGVARPKNGDGDGNPVCDIGAFEADFTQPVYRFWSSDYFDHFYTMSEAERNLVNSIWSDYYMEEGVGFYAYPMQLPGSMPVYRFWSPIIWSHFYTISEVERDYIMTNWPGFWAYEGVAFYAYPTQIPGTQPVFRFWNSVYGTHFFTISQAERDYVAANFADWIYEGIGFYAYAP